MVLVQLMLYVSIRIDLFYTVLLFTKTGKLCLPILKEFDVKEICVWDIEAAEQLKQHTTLPICIGMEGLLSLVSQKEISYVVNGLVGAIGCIPTLKAIENGKKVGLANKENNGNGW